MISPENVGMSSERLARIRPVVEQHIGDDKIVGAVLLVARRGEVVDQECVGLMDRERRKPMQPDTIFRIYSMAKPITSVAMMVLYERGYFQLFDPVSKFIPAFNDLKVCAGGSASDPELVDLERPVTIRDLLTHTSGLTYHFWEYGAVEKMYRETRLWSNVPLAELVADLLQLPLAFQPGTAWRYSVSYDVLAYLVETMSGQDYDVFLHRNLFEPLGMLDTGFFVPESKLERFAAMYGSSDLMEPEMTFSEWYRGAAEGINRPLADAEESLESGPHHILRGGHGLVSTAPDYLRFCRMLLNQGEMNGTRILSRKTVELMTVNHLASGLLPFEMAGWPFQGYGYGLGVDVLMDIAQAQTLGSNGVYSWAGIAGTRFWVDPQEKLIGILMIQFQPGGYHPVANHFRVAAYQSIAD
ncbi:MAG: serine hydrolase domain-containing protein [Anaerolineae bacterium]